MPKNSNKKHQKNHPQNPANLPKNLNQTTARSWAPAVAVPFPNYSWHVGFSQVLCMGWVWE